ncbi:MAG: B12-binding domain-containing radical SAM protein [Oscillospiraceae bacterium]|nr:B12-binding domain-containing radical SAM protein [Oscillospiraceae bacterium]
MGNRRVLLVNFYNPKPLGFRFLETALADCGFEVTILYFKGFHSARPQRPTPSEIAHLLDLLDKTDPLFIGFSVMTSLYLEVVEEVSRQVRAHAKAPLVWGGVYATLFPERCLENDHCDYVIRGEGEGAIAEFASLLSDGCDTKGVLNLAYREREGGKAVVNPVRPLVTDLDTLRMAGIGLDNKYFIDDGAISRGDPMLGSYSYETACSRGCPFVCSYCSTVSIKRIYRDNRHFLRFRSVASVIDELKEAKRRMKSLSLIHFWDEIFPGDSAWIDEFAARYAAEIGLPFEIWAHPLKTDAALLQKLRAAGLFQVVMGIQSGSPQVRKEAFHRTESQDQILAAASALADARVPRVVYDFILRHPFETTQQLRETYELCDMLPGRFTLQLHDLGFLPGTDIAAEAIKRKIYTPGELDALMYAPIERQYAAWWESDCDDEEKNFWYHLTYVTQFPSLKRKARRLAAAPGAVSARRKAGKYYIRGKRRDKYRRYRQKLMAIASGKMKKIKKIKKI